MKRLICTILAFFLFSFPARAEDDPVGAWYEALRAIDRGVFDTILAEDARIILKDRQMIQNKAEFVNSLDVWEKVAEDMDLQFQADRRGANEIVARVCYILRSGSFTNLELFIMKDGKIIQQVQEKLQDGC